MARAPDPRIEEAKSMYLKGMKLVEIASQLNLPEGTVRRWKCTHKWESERSEKKSERSEKKKRGAQPGNSNSSGGPPKNKKAEKHGLFSKYLPDETMEIVNCMVLDPLDILWDQIQIAYAAIIRAQQIMYVKDRNDKTIEKVKEGNGDKSFSEEWEVQQAWDKQANFLKAQARAQGELRAMIKQYDEMLDRNFDTASDEQKARIEQMRANTERLKRGTDPEQDDGVNIINDVPKETD